MSVAVHTCAECGAAIHNPQARNCSFCGKLLASLPLAPGSLISGQYRVVRPIKSGGTGALYLAEDLKTFNRRCVIKRLHAGSDPSTRARFASEVQTLINLRHPQVPQVYAYVDDGDSVLIIMEYVAGTDLEQGLSLTTDDGRFLPGKPRPLPPTIRDALVVCSILEHLHSRKPPVVHCDIKPANLIRDEESDAVFLVDFGAAAHSGAGENYGTPGYAPPELYQGQRMPASDIYALAATVYHLLTDDDPCDHPGRFPKLGQLPSAVSQALGRALQANPASRPSAATFRSELEAALADPAKTRALRFPSGDVPGNSQELADAIRQNWSFGVDAMVDNKLDEWLRDHGHASMASWLVQTRRETSADVALDALVRQLDPLTRSTDVRFGQQAIELPATKTATATPLWVVARGGMAKMAVIQAPLWLQIGPQSLTLRPETPEAFYMTVDPDRMPNFNQQGSVVFEAAVGGGKIERYTLPASIADGPGTLKATAKQPVNLLWLIGSWVGLALLAFITYLMFPAAVAMIIQLAWGGAIGALIAWITSASPLDWGLEAGASALGSVTGGTVIPLLASGSPPNAAGMIPILLSTLVAALASIGYIFLTE
ncbi:MAG TPA: serine/threonine-protein kinase [Herpetosiphonaceae bacterium]